MQHYENLWRNSISFIQKDVEEQTSYGIDHITMEDFFETITTS